MARSWPGRPTWYMTSLRRPSTNALRMRAPISSSTWSQLIRCHFPAPRAPARLSG